MKKPIENTQHSWSHEPTRTTSPDINNTSTTFQFEDKRPQTDMIKTLQRVVQNSHVHKNTSQLKAMVNSANLRTDPLQKKTNTTGLPDALKNGVEQLSGYSMDDVKVQFNSSKPAQLNAHAYAQGTEIHLAPGQEQHLPHEAWHVVQQKQGRVKPTKQLKPRVAINDDIGLEKEADQMGTLANNKGEQYHKDNFLIQQKQANLKNVSQSENPSLQRKIGFEFEVGLPFGKAGKKVKTMFGEHYNLVDPKLGPDVHIHDGTGFHVVEDHGGVNIFDVESIVEYVIDAEEEHKDKGTFLTNVKNAKGHIDKFSAADQKKFPDSGSEYYLGGGQMQNAGKRGVGQATFAVRLEGITAMFDNKIKDDTFGGEDKVLFSKKILERAKLVASETVKLVCLSGLGEVKKVEGYLALVSQYLAANAISLEDAPILDKNRVPFLVRSQMSVIRDSTLNVASRTALSGNVDTIYAKMIAVSKANPAKAIIPKKGDPKTSVWLKGTLVGADPAIAWGQSKIIAPEPIGSLGLARDSGGVVEQRHLKFGAIPVSEWEAAATKVYEEARKLNGID